MNHHTTPSRYDITWTSPSGTYDGSMPLGNGDIAVNAWVDNAGDLLFYIAKGDSWDDYGRLLKIGRVRVRLSPPPPQGDFMQTLTLGDGTITCRFRGGGAETLIRLRVDANNPVISVSIESSEQAAASASFEVWRTAPEPLGSVEVSDVLIDDPAGRETIVEPDIVIEDLNGRIALCHHNGKSIGPALTAAGQGLDGFPRQDPLLGRTFGALITADGASRTGPLTLTRPVAAVHRFDIFVHTAHPSTVAGWLSEIEGIAQDVNAVPENERRSAHVEWWRDFWDRSRIDVRTADGSDEDPESDAFIVSRAYALQRFMNACAGRGRYPIKFNGSLFTVPYQDAPGDADYRKWGPGYWWQNTRLPYIGMCTSGDFDLMPPLFRMYARELMPLFRHRVQVYFGHGGAFIPECIYFWGDVFTHTYGWTPFEEREDKLQEGGWHKWEWVSGPELVFMMLDYYEHTLDEAFLTDTLLPAADEIIRFFDEHYRTDVNGRLNMHPSQALETWWDCTDPMPEIAGLHAVTGRLLALPDRLLSADRRAYWSAFSDKLPDIPTVVADGKTMLAPAARFADKRNVENPELYAVFPFRLFALDRPNAEWAEEALRRRLDRGAEGWRQDDIFMAYLGLAEDAKKNLVARSRNSHKGSRFPAFWGPNYDWVPDQDHGGILVKALQAMLMQCDGKEILLLPAWPAGWEADFKLHAPYATTVRGSIRGGDVVDLVVTPAERLADVRVMKKV